MKHKTAELEGFNLNQAVALAERLQVTVRYGVTGKPSLIQVLINGELVPWSPSTAWDHGGPIIEHERIDLEHDAQVQEWRAVHPKHYDGPPYASALGETALIAAMRAFVASRYGDEVELP